MCSLILLLNIVDTLNFLYDLKIIRRLTNFSSLHVQDINIKEKLCSTIRMS
jgi:hypothetical protein